MLRNSIKSARFFRAYLAATVLVGVSLLCGAPAFAVDSQVNVVVCGDQIPPAEVTLTEPKDDSVVSLATLTFRGTVAHTSQLEIAIDDQYVSTLAIGPGQTTFETGITLSPGTHTVQVTALAICGGEDGIDSVVITYQPATEPSNGESTPTTVDGTVTLEGEPASTEAIDQNDIIQQIKQLPVIGPIINGVSGLSEITGLEATLAGNNTPLVAGVVRVGLTVAALTSVVMASTFAPIAAQAIPGVSEIFNVSSHRSMMYLGWVIRGVGVLAMALAYFV